MSQRQVKYYPTILGAIHLVILYIFIQAIIDFPLAVWDYYHGSELLYNPIKKVILGVGSILFILYYGYRKAKTKISELFPAKWFNPLIFIPMILFLLAAQIFLTEINEEVMKIIPVPIWFWELFDRIFENDYGFYGAFMKVVIIAPIVEELIFRGIIMHGFMRNYPKIIAIIISALLFALFHLNPWQFPATFSLGLLLGWIMVITRNIFACIAGHAINNLLVLLTIQYWEEIQQFPIFMLDSTDQLKLSYFVAGLSITLLGLFSVFKIKKAT